MITIRCTANGRGMLHKISKSNILKRYSVTIIAMARSWEAISLKLPEELLRESDRLAEGLKTSRAAYIRSAIEERNRRLIRQERRDRMQEASRKVRGESMKVNEEFAAIESDPDA